MSELTSAQRAGWDEVGWLHLPGALTAPARADLVEWVDDVAAWAAADGPGLHHREATEHGPALARSERFVDHHAALAEFVRRGAPAELAGALLGEPAVLFKEKINYKHPGGGGFAPHQDAAAYRFVEHHVSVLVAVDGATVESGCLWFAPGHRRGLLATDGRGRIDEAVVATLDWRAAPVEAGDLVGFDSYAPHRSGTNRSAGPRRALYLTYNGASLGDQREAYYADKEAEFAREGSTFDGERVRISVSDDFLGRPLPGAG